MALALLFHIDDETYGLEVESIQEVVEDPELHFVPLARGVLKNVISFHGQILPVIDLPRLLGFPGQERDHRLVVLIPEHHSLVLLVSGIERIVALDLALQQPAPTEAEGHAVRGVVPHEERLVNLLDTDSVIHLLKSEFKE